ncbi:hypothetical protein Tco_0580945 [Tanacetum coccineum]
MDAIVGDVVVSAFVDPLIADVITYLSDDSRKQALQLLSDGGGKVRDFVDTSICFVTSATSSATLIDNSSTSSTTLSTRSSTSCLSRNDPHGILLGYDESERLLKKTRLSTAWRGNVLRLQPLRFPTVNEKLPKADESRNATAKDEIIHSFGGCANVLRLQPMWELLRLPLRWKLGSWPTWSYSLTDIVTRNSFADVKQNLLLPSVGHIRVGTPSDFGKKRGNKFNGFRVKRMTISGGSRFQAGVWNGLFSGLMDFLISEKLPSSCFGLAYEVIRFEILKANLKKAQVAWERVAKEQQKVVEECERAAVLFGTLPYRNSYTHISSAVFDNAAVNLDLEKIMIGVLDDEADLTAYDGIGSEERMLLLKGFVISKIRHLFSEVESKSSKFFSIK